MIFLNEMSTQQTAEQSRSVFLMISQTIRWAMVFCFSAAVFAYAPVVDDRENFALLEEQQLNPSQPLAHESFGDTDRDQDTPLARESANKEEMKHNADIINRLQGLEQDIQALRGQLEVQAREIKALQEQQLSFYKDLDERLRTKAMVAKPAPVETPAEQPKPISSAHPTTSESLVLTPQVASNHSNPADEQISYLAAYDLVKTKQFDEAIAAMQSFIDKYPQGGYTANAHYWLGELQLVKKNYAEAVKQFDLVLTQFPASSKCSASLLKAGYALAASGQVDAARSRLQTVLKKYPDTQPARLASVKLQNLGG